MSSCSRSPASTLRSPRRSAEIGVSVVSVGDLLDDTNELLALDDVFRESDATLVVGAAMSPGLSGLIARHLASQLASSDEIHVAVHGTAGPACARQHHRALAGFAPGWHDGEWIERRAGSGRELCWFPEPVGARDCYRAELTDPLLLHLAFPDAVRISARVSATRRDRLTSSLPMLRNPHAEGLEGALRVEVRGADRDGGRQTVIAGIAERAGTAAAAMAAVFAGAAGWRRTAVRGGRQRRCRTRHGGSAGGRRALRRPAPGVHRRRPARLNRFTGRRSRPPSRRAPP